MEGILFDPRGTSVVTFTWVIGILSNNLAKAYALLRSLQIAREVKVRSSIILGYSSIMI